MCGRLLGGALTLVLVATRGRPARPDRIIAPVLESPGKEPRSGPTGARAQQRESKRAKRRKRGRGKKK